MDTLFHYTSEEAARSIIEDEADFGLYFQVGVGNWHGHGLYATDIAPVDRESMDDDRLSRSSAWRPCCWRSVASTASAGRRSGTTSSSKGDKWLIPLYPLLHGRAHAEADC